ncbi:MAG: hypothetical protein HND52_06670 [Ignavibacteriae bacterium]|nr:hypothetical protein [Ignavibacteriota bacterium]NOG97625.1 hypothetical protein [Ignavibacteriota bacterium]
MIKKLFTLLILSAILLPITNFGQKDTNPNSDFKKILGAADRRTGIHDGNLVYTRFSNFGNLGSRYEPPKMEWPKGSGTWYGYEFIMIAGAEVTDANGNTIHIMSENYTNPGSFDISPDGTHTYGWEPLPGYFNYGPENTNEFPAMSHLPETWPGTWIHDYPGTQGSRDGLWNGEFGAYTRADQESYYVMDDRNNDEFEYYPYVGSAVDSAGYPNGRRGLGLEVKVRGYQWVQVEAEDILITRYDIQNVSDKDLSKVVFGMYVDPAVGGEGDSQDDDAYFEHIDDITYCWDLDGIDNKGRPGVGYFGFAFLESPGDPLNGIDDDDDGLIDEVQSNDAGSYIFGPVGIFGEDKWHWSGDEDGDWRSYEDINENGVWDPNEPIFDDVGSDGIGPNDQDYTGPDFDGTEANGMPDQGEPNFGFTDNDESDQIGLTSFVLRPAGNISADETTWNEMIPGYFGGVLPGNLAFIYGSGYFSLPQNETRKFAVACLFGNDFDDIIRNKRTMQRIYDADYNFTKPPLLPTVKATPQDKRVILTWDARAEQSIDPIYKKDFEGYLIYRSTDPSFNSIKLISDSYGNPIFWEPIAQFDYVNGLSGPHPVPIGETGANFNMGTDNGLVYSYIDNNVENGRTYYYAVVSYDKGYDTDFYSRGLTTQENLAPAAPSECSKIIQTNLVGDVISVGRNCAVVVPNAPSAGYTDPHLKEGVIHSGGVATGSVSVDALVADEILNDHVYQVVFTDTTFARATKSITIKDATENRIVYHSDVYDPTYLESIIIEGLKFQLENDTVAVVDQGWNVGGGGLTASIGLLESPKQVKLPEDFEIRVGEAGIDTSFAPLAFQRSPVNFEVWSTTTNQQYEFLFDETIYKDSILNTGDEIVIALDARGFQYKTAMRLNFDHGGDSTKITPAVGDVFQFKVSKPFNADDIYEFVTIGAEIDKEKAKNNLDDIYVVPDPYVSNASWEKPLFYSAGRGERRIDFVNLPTKCTIRIYTMSGVLVKTIERNAAEENGAESWDLTTEDGLTVAFGMYIFHVDGFELGEKIGKFALIK